MASAVLIWTCGVTLRRSIVTDCLVIAPTTGLPLSTKLWTVRPIGIGPPTSL